MSEERLRVLEMVREGKITPEEGARLLEALREGTREERRRAREDDPIGSLVESVVESVTGALSGKAWTGWKGSWAGAWHGGHFGSLAGLRRRQEREAEGWQFLALSEGDRGTFEVPEGARLAIESEAGGIEAKAVDGPARVDLEGDDFYNFAVYVARKDDQVVLAAHRTEPHARMPRLVVRVPRHVSHLSLQTAGGGLDVRGFSCPVELKTAGGGIRVRAHGDGALAARTAGGGIDVEGQPAQANLKTAGGGIHFRGLTGAFVAETAGGSITIDGARLLAGEHRARTAGGSIRVHLTPDSSVAIDASTTAGNISVDLPGVQGQFSGSRLSPKYQGTYNGGSASLELRTVGGSITVGLAEAARAEAA